MTTPCIDQKLTISDPIGALVAWLKQPEQCALIGDDTYVTAPLLTSKAVPILKAVNGAIALKSAGIGSGTGHDEQAPYASIRVDCLAYAKTDFGAQRLSLLAHRAILRARQRTVMYEHDSITYKTGLKTIVQSGGPLPLRDEHTDWPAVMRVFNVEASEVLVDLP